MRISDWSSDVCSSDLAFERVGQEATRRLTEHLFGHLHQLSLRFHLNRKTGAVTKIIERGTKSIDVMLYFLLFNIAPTVIELVAVCVIFFLRSEEHTSELQSLMRISYAVFCLKKKTTTS